MSKERLEINHAIEIIKRETVIAKGLNNSNYNVNLPIDLAVMLIEQAQRVEKSERENTPGIELNLLNDENVRLEKQNKRYRDHLKYMLDEAKDHKKIGLRIQHWALIKDLERALEGDSDE